MKKYLQNLIVAGTVFVLAGCGGSGAPSCSDSEVKKLVQEISGDELKAQLFKTFLSQSGMRVANPSYEVWKNNPPREIKEIIEIVDKVDTQFNKMNLSLGSIRINDKNDEIRKSECGASITFSDGKSFSINFTAQYTEEDDVYVEVFGL